MGDLAPKADIPAALARLIGPGAVAALAGPHAAIAAFVTAALSEVIPNRRFERLETLFMELAKRVERLTDRPLPTGSIDDDRVSLLEDGMWSAARAGSRTRIEYIANVLANGLAGADARAEDRRYLLRLLEEINDVEVITLSSFGFHDRDEFYRRHESSLDYEPATYGAAQDIC